VAPFEEDLEAYRNLLLNVNTGSEKTEKKKERPKRMSRDAILALRADVRKCEERVAKLQQMETKLAAKLADHSLYEDARVGELEVWNRKYAELRDAMEKAEALWMSALEKLERAESATAA
jgi:ATP-binding cassette subfamily F protein 3